LVPRQVLARRYRERLAKLRRVVVRAADRLHLAVAEQLLVAAQRIVDRGVGVRKVAEVEIDRVDPESPQRVLRRLEDTLRRQALLVGSELCADLRDDHGVVALAGAREPVADDRLGLAAPVALDPHRVRVGRVDRVESVSEKGVEQLDRAALVDGPAENVAAEYERGDRESRSDEGAFVHVRSLVDVRRISRLAAVAPGRGTETIVDCDVPMSIESGPGDEAGARRKRGLES